MLIIPLLKSYRRRPVGLVPPPPGVPPILVEASFDAGTLVLTLGFDRAVELGALDPTEITVDDGPGTGLSYQGSGPVILLSPERFTLGMSAAGASGGMAVLLIASLSNGIVSDDGGVWAGTGSGAVLPIPTPPPPAVVIAAVASGYGCTLQFDRTIVLLGTLPGDAILFDGLPAIGVNNYAPDLLGFECSNFLGSGSTWEIVRQPAWVATVLAQPVSGVFA